MEASCDKATPTVSPLELLLWRNQRRAATTGRPNLLLDSAREPDPTNPMPYTAVYVAESIRNWDDGEADEGEARLNLVDPGRKRSYRSTDLNGYRRPAPQPIRCEGQERS
ncbi:portal protein [Pseudomonas phage PIP]|nr:portal protein [Pseudomonas phage PIP]